MKLTEEKKELRLNDIKGLTKLLDKEYAKIQQLKFAQAFRKIKDTTEITKTRKRIARLWSIIGEKVEANVED